MKKVLSLVLALAMVLSSMSFAFAGTFEDVTDETTAKAVSALSALGIVNGNPDGTYKPENVVTRAEMAKMLVVALGHDGLVDGSKTSFKDAQGKWYEGYVSIASGLKIISGYPDGTFKGDNTVSYEEATVMILRALGYTNATVNGGIDAYNVTAYKTMASKLGILKNVVFKTAGANRGDIAKMLYNSLEARTVVTNDKGKAEEIVIGEYLNKETDRIEKDYEILLDRVASKVTINKVEAKMVDSDNKAYLGNLVDLKPYMYQKITVYKNDDGDVVFVKGSSSDTVVGKLATSKTDAGNLADGNIKVTVSDTKTSKLEIPAAGIPVFYNGAEITLTEALMESGSAKVGKLVGAKVTVVLNDDEDVIGMVAEKATTVTRVATEYIAGKLTLDGKNIYLPVNSDDKVDLNNLVVKGDATALEDIKEDDVVEAFIPAGSLVKSEVPASLTLLVTRNTIEGAIKSIDADNGNYFIDGTSYKISPLVSGLTLALKDEGIFYLDSDGKIVSYDVDSIVATDYAVITKVVNGETSTGGRVYDAEITMVNNKGEKIVYGVATSALLTGKGTSGNIPKDTKILNKATGDAAVGVPNKHYVLNANVITNRLVKYSLNKDGDISALEIVDIDTTNDKNDAVERDTTAKDFALASNAIIFSRDNEGVYTVVAADKLADKIKVTAIAENSRTGEIQVLVVDGLGSSTGTYAFITKNIAAVNDSDVNARQITAIVNGETVKYFTTDDKIDLSGKVDNGVIVSLNFDGDEVSTATVVTGSAIVVPSFKDVESVNGNRFKVDGVWYTLASENSMVIVLDADGDFDYAGDISSLRGSTVKVFNVDKDNGTNVVEIIIVQ